VTRTAFFVLEQALAAGRKRDTDVGGLVDTDFEGSGDTEVVHGNTEDIRGGGLKPGLEKLTGNLA
jgi:hypothetical protein